MRKSKRPSQVKSDAGLLLDRRDLINTGSLICYPFHDGNINSAFDIVSGMHATMTGTISSSVGRFGTCPRHTQPAAVPSYYALPNISGRFTTQGTFSVWVKRDVSPPGVTGESGSWALQNNGSTNHYPYTDSNIYDGTFSSVRKTVGLTRVPLTQWHHVCITANQTTNVWRFYQNGILLFSSTVGTFSMTTAPLIGGSSAAFGMKGQMDLARLWTRELAPSEAMRLTVEPFAGFLPRRRRIISLATSGYTITVNQVTETDLAQAISVNPRRRLVGQVSETDLAQAVARAKVKALGQNTETDTAQAVSRLKTKALGQSSETDLAQQVSRAGTTHAVGQVSETDTAQPVSWAPKRRLVGQVAEADSAQAVTRIKRRTLGQVSEVDTAQAVARLKRIALGIASETDFAQAIIVVGGAVVTVIPPTEDCIWLVDQRDTVWLVSQRLASWLIGSR